MTWIILGRRLDRSGAALMQKHFRSFYLCLFRTDNSFAPSNYVATNALKIS